MRLLLVEDNPGDVELVRERIARARGTEFELEVVEDLDEAFDAIRSAAPEVVLLDLGLPGTRGIETLAAFRIVAPCVPVVVMTGIADLDLALEALRRGADDYVVKGELTPEMLRRSVVYAVERRRLFEQARHAVEARDEILRIVSHDVRNQLSTITVGLRLIRTEGGSERVTRRIDQLERAAGTITRLIGDLLDIHALEKGTLAIHPQPQDAGALLDAAAAQFGPTAEAKAIHFRTAAPDAPVSVLCDRDRFAQVVGNLVGNALRFTPPQGEIVLSCGPDAPGFFRFCVSDSGPGIPERFRDRVFDRFFRGERSVGDGLGLGLTIARAIVEAHRGRIWVDPPRGGGATLCFTMPAA